MAANLQMDIAHRFIQAQDDEDTVILPNACKGELIELGDGAQVRCFSMLTRQPHTVPPESWTMIETPELPAIDGMHEVVADRLLVDNVSRGFIGNNAMQFITGQDGNVESIRLLPPDSTPAQAQWEAQAAKMIE